MDANVTVNLASGIVGSLVQAVGTKTGAVDLGAFALAATAGFLYFKFESLATMMKYGFLGLTVFFAGKAFGWI